MSRPLTIMTAPDRQCLDELVAEALERRIDPWGRPRFLYMSPTKRKCRETAARLSLRKPSWRATFAVPMELAERTADMTGDAPPVVGDELKALLVAAILDEPKSRESLETLLYSSGPAPPGTARRLARLLDTLTRRRLSPGDPESGVRPACVNDTAYVMRRYRELLGEQGLADPLDVVDRAIDYLERTGAEALGSPDTLVLDGFVAPERLEADFIVAVARAVSKADGEIILTAPARFLHELEERGWDGLTPESRVFRHGREFFERVGVDGPSAGKSLGATPKPSTQSAQPRPLRSYVDRAEEVKGMARTVKRMFFSEDGAPRLRPEDVHIVVPNIDPYYRLFIEIFPRYGIPFNITRGIPLSSIPVVGLILALMDAVIDRDQESLFRFFSSDLVQVPPLDDFHDRAADFIARYADALAPAVALLGTPAQDDIPAKRLDTTALVRFCREAGIRGGPDFRLDWVAEAARHFERSALERRTEEDDTGLDRLKQRFLDVLGILICLEAEFERFDTVSGAATAGERVAALRSLMGRYDLDRSLVRSLASMESTAAEISAIMREKNVKGFAAVPALLEEISDDLQTVGKAEITVEQFREIFRRRCRSEMIQEAGELAGVGVSQLLEVRNLHRPLLLMGGLTADDFPPAPASDFLVSAGPETEAFRASLDESRHILDEALRNSETAILSYPVSAGGEALQPSLLLEELLVRGAIREETDPEAELEPLCAYEVKEFIGRIAREGEPVPWDAVGGLLRNYPAASDTAVERLHEDVRSAFIAAILRFRTDREGAYDGIIEDPLALKVIGEVVESPSFAYSVSMLNDYRKCPLMFFFKRILALEPPREIPEEPEPADIGTAVHEILARFYDRRRRDGLGRITPVNRLDAVASLWEIAEETFDRFAFLSPDRLDGWAVRRRTSAGLYPADRLSDAEFRRRVEEGSDMADYRRGPLRRLIDFEAKLDFPIETWSVEHPFGYERNPPLIITDGPARRMRIRGKIDRIDLFTPPAASKPAAVLALDYKTGSCPTNKDVQSRQDLQLHVYVLAALDIFRDLGVERAGGCFAALNADTASLWKAPIVTEGFPEDSLKAMAGRPTFLTRSDLDDTRGDMLDIDADVRAGNFPRTRDARVCERCPYIEACFRDERRVKIVSAAP